MAATPVEAGKRLDAMMLAGDAVVAIDNIEVPLEGAVLCQMLTQPARRIRVLGTHTVVTVPSVQMVTATGCNLVLRGDIVRRVIICRLDAKTDRPELRVIQQDLIAEVRERRRELFGDLITMLLAHQQAGQPDTGVSPLGGFGHGHGWCARHSSGLARPTRADRWARSVVTIHRDKNWPRSLGLGKLR